MNKKFVRENTFNFIEVLLIVVITAIVFSCCTGVILYNKISNENKIVESKEMNEFISAYSSIIDNYYKEVDKDKLITTAIEAMYTYLDDPYTTYLSKNSASNLMDSLNGEYTGIGVQIKEQDDNVLISKVLDNSPAKKVGVEENDILLRINDKDITTYELTGITDLIKKTEGIIKITILRNNKEIIFNVEKEDIELQVVSSDIFNNIGYIKIEIFGENASSQVKEALKKLESYNIQSLIIDLRDNSGGYLSSATSIAEQFLEKGKIIYKLENKSSNTTYKDKTKSSFDKKIIVLINERTASASEVLAGALKDSYNATLLGTNSYGKGKVQQTKEFNNGSMVKYTSSKWYTPNGICIDGKGLTPDIVVELDSNSTLDNQLEKAKETLITE